MAKIIFCDDDEFIRKLICVIMRASLHESHVVENGREALELAERELPDLIFMDAFMLEMNGFQVLEALKSRPSLSHIPVILLTGSSDDATLQSLQQKGWAGYLAKPFNSADLRAKIEEILGLTSAN